MRSIALLIISLLLINQTSLSQTCCSGGVPLSANIGLPTGEKGSLQFSLNYDFNQLKTLKIGNNELDDRRRERITHSVLFQTGYTFSKRFSVDLVLSYIRQERNIFTQQGTNSTVTNGIGDGVLLLKYSIFPKKMKTSLVIGIGPKIPFGTTDKTSDNGFALPADLQPGSGSWDAVFWSSFSQSLGFRRTMSISAISTFRATGVNPDYLGSIEYEFGNELQIITGIADRFLIRGLVWDPSISFRYRKAQRDTNNRVEIDATGGEWIFFMPGLKFSFNPYMSVNLSMEIPIYSFVNNTQLTPTRRFTLGLYYKINKNKLI
jgi:hypothetical protein